MTFGNEFEPLRIGWALTVERVPELPGRDGRASEVLVPELTVRGWHTCEGCGGWTAGKFGVTLTAEQVQVLLGALNAPETIPTRWQRVSEFVRGALYPRTVRPYRNGRRVHRRWAG